MTAELLAGISQRRLMALHPQRSEQLGTGIVR